MSKDEINAFMGANTTYEGKLTFQGAVRIDGVFSGEIVSDGALIVGKDAQVDGTLSVGELVLSGKFTGEVRATRRVLIHKAGYLEGILRSPVLVMEEGATIQGQTFMRKEDTEK